MIGSLCGKLAWRGGDVVIIDVNGVGYEVTLSGGALGLCGAIGSDIRLVVYTDVRENSISLFGFADTLEKQVFLLAKKVKGIGSRLSMAIISSIGAEGLLVAVGQQNMSAIQRVPGVGKKTSERIIVELREQVGEFVKELQITERAESIPTITPHTQKSESLYGLTLTQNDAMLALEKLGVPSEKARQAISLALSSGVPVSDSGDLVRLALANL